MTFFHSSPELTIICAVLFVVTITILDSTYCMLQLIFDLFCFAKS